MDGVYIHIMNTGGNSMYYVTATDKFMSGWGMAEGKINRLVFPCDTERQATAMYHKLRERGDMIRIHMGTTKPRYNERTHYTQWKKPSDFGITSEYVVRPCYFLYDVFFLHKADATRYMKRHGYTKVGETLGRGYAVCSRGFLEETLEVDGMGLADGAEAWIYSNRHDAENAADSLNVRWEEAR